MKTVRNVFLVLAVIAVSASLLAMTSYPSSSSGKGGGNPHSAYGWGHSATKPSHGKPLLSTPAEDITLTPGTPTETVTDEPTGTVTVEPSATAEPSETVTPTDEVTPTNTAQPTVTDEPTGTAAPTETATGTPDATLTPGPTAAPNVAPVIKLDPTPRRGRPDCPPATMTPILKFLASARLLPARWAACIAQ